MMNWAYRIAAFSPLFLMWFLAEVGVPLGIAFVLSLAPLLWALWSSGTLGYWHSLTQNGTSLEAGPDWTAHKRIMIPFCAGMIFWNALRLMGWL